MSGLTGAGVALLVTAIVEIAVLVVVTHLLGGVLWTVLLVLATSAAGSLLLRREGMRAWRRFRDAAAQGLPPGEQVSDGLVGLAGALLLLIPGFVTDAVGLALLLPPVRRLASGRAQAFAQRRISPAVAGDLFGPRRVRMRREAARAEGAGSAEGPGSPQGSGEAIEGEIIDPR